MDFNPEILKRFFEGKYSSKDYLEVKSAFFDLDKRSQLKNYLEKHWDEFSDQEIPQSNMEQLIHQIHHKIRLEENTNRRYNFTAVFQKIAAILIIPLILSFLAFIYFNSEKQWKNSQSQGVAYAEIQCPMGVRTKFELPDGTTGFLNSGSRLKYPVDFINERNVTVNGEAYFDVFHDKAHPFVVETQNLKVKALGTQFNVIAYENNPDEEVILNSGKVEVTTSDGQRLDILDPNQMLVLNTEKRAFKTSDVEAYQYIGWTEGKLIFRNEDMAQVARRLSRWYNIELEIEDEELYKYAFRATFVDESLEEVFELMALTAPFTYKEEPRKITNEIFEKRKFLLKLDQERLKAFN